MDKINEGRGALYFICVLIQRHEQAVFFRKIKVKAMRGSVVKSLALCSKTRRIEPFKRILLMALVDYFNATSPKMTIEESISKGRPIIENLYKVLMGIQYSHIPRLHYSERKLFKYSASKTWEKSYFSYLY